MIFRGPAKALLVACVLVCFGCGFAPDYYRIAAVQSPRRTLVADWYERMDGGPVGGSEDRVVVHDSQEVFSTELPYVFAGISADNLRIVWTSETELAITYPKDTTVIKALREWKGVTIAYTMDPLM